MIALLVPCVHFDEANVNLHQTHAVFGSDLDITELSCEFTEVASQKNVASLELPHLVKHLAVNADSYPNVLCILSRILAAKPHSADVERCIRANKSAKDFASCELEIGHREYILNNSPQSSTHSYLGP